MVVAMKINVARDRKPCILANMYRLCRGTCCFHLQGSGWKSRLLYKRWYLSTSIRSTISQKTLIFIITAYQEIVQGKESISLLS